MERKTLANMNYQILNCKHRTLSQTGQVNTQSYLPIIFFNTNQSACSTLDWVLNSQSEFDYVLVKHQWDFAILFQ